MASEPAGDIRVVSTRKLVEVIHENLHVSSRPIRLRKVNDYLLKTKLLRSPTCQIYFGVEESTGLYYSIKRIKLRELGQQSCAVTQLEREIRFMRTFNHRNILKLKEVLLVESVREVYLILEYASKGSLAGFIERGQRLSLESIFSIIKQVVSAIKYLHETGYVHQDIRPGNIAIDETGRAIISDFGIGHSYQSAGMVVGSPAFQAPEALDDENDEENYDKLSPQKEDIWALGVTLYQLLFMRLPFPGENLYEIVIYAREHDLAIDDCDPAIEQLLRGMLTVDPAKRLGLDDLIENPLIKNASDLANDLPAVPPPEFRDGEIIQIQAKVCPAKFSFAGLAMQKSDKFFIKSAPRKGGISDRQLKSVRKRVLPIGSSDDDDVVMSSPKVKK